MNGIAAKYSPAADRAQRIADIGKDRATFVAGADAAGLSKEVQKSVLSGMDDAISKLKNETLTEFSSAIQDLGDQFGGTFGRAISKVGKALDRIVSAANGDLGGAGILGKAAGFLGGDVAEGFKQANREVLGKLGDQLKDVFGIKGAFGKTLGQTLGKLSAGAELGQVSGQLVGALGLKSSKMGSQLGGALGSVVGGPLGALVGGFIGGALGGLLKKTKYGTAEVSLSGGELGVGSLTGNKEQFKTNASSAVGMVASGVQSIADALGAVISGDPSVSIGQVDGKWRVSTTGRTGKLKSKYSDVTDFGKDGGDAAVAFAVESAIRDGILSGLSDFSSRILQQAPDFEKAVNLATSYEKLLDELAAIDDPIAASITGVTESLDKMLDQMRKAGATSAELANVERYKQVQLDKLLADQLSSLKDFQKTLDGSAAGRTSLQQLTADLADFAKYEADLRAGKTVDNQAFASLGTTILQNAGDLYGTSTAAFQSLRDRLATANQETIANVTARYEQPADTALVQAQTKANETAQAQLAEQAKTNEYLRQLVESGRVDPAINYAAAAGGYVNGRAAVRLV